MPVFTTYYGSKQPSKTARVKTFIPNSIQKTKDVKALANRCGNMNLKIEIDGGVSITNAKDLIAAGANVLVAGNFVFNSKNPKLTISDLLKLGE